MGYEIDDLSNEELDQIEQRAAAACPGPWCSFVVGLNTEAGLNYIEQGCCTTFELLGGTVADQEFVAAAREDVPRLVLEVRRLRARLVELERIHGSEHSRLQASAKPPSIRPAN